MPIHPDNLMLDANRIVYITYTNYRGEKSTYKILPHSMFFGRTQFHPEEQWFVNATDVDRNIVRNFAMKDVEAWTL